MAASVAATIAETMRTAPVRGMKSVGCRQPGEGLMASKGLVGVRASNRSLRELLEGSKVFVVPLFQRQYSWGRREWRALWENVVEQYDFQTDENLNGQPELNHFIGSFVLSPSPGSGDPPQRILVVDGQQRLITTSALLAALRDLRWERAKDVNVRRWLEDDFSKAYLVNSVLSPTVETKYRVLPTQEDREAFFSLVTETPGSPIGRVGEAYRYFRREARGRNSSGELFDLEQLTNVLLSRLSLVEIQTESGDNVHRVFQTLNSSGVLLKQIDLLRNHFFMLLPSRAEELYRGVWREMELRLGEATLDRFMWASLVPFDQRVSRKTVFVTMERLLDRTGGGRSEDTVEDLLRSLNKDSKQYLKLLQPEEERRLGVQTRLRCLHRWGTDTYHPLGLALLKASNEGVLDDDALERCLLAIESFLVRRMLVGIPTNNLNRIFAAVTNGLPRESIEPWLMQGLASIGRIWPSDTMVRTAVAERPFFFAGQPGQRRFVLERLEGRLSNVELPDLPKVEVQHIMPVLGGGPDPRHRAEYEQLVHTIGNATLVPRGLVSESEPAESKLDAYGASGLELTRSLGGKQAWSLENVAQRSQWLAELVIELWPAVKAETGGPIAQDRSEGVVLLLPEDGYTTVADLAELWSTSDAEVSEALRSWPADQLRRVFTNDELAAVEQFGDLPAKASEFGQGEFPNDTLSKRFSATDLAALLEEEDRQYLEQQDS